MNEQDTGKGSHGHDSFQSNVYDSASLREHGSQSYDHERNHEIHGLLKNEINYTHDFVPPSLTASAFSPFCLWILERMILTIRANALK